MTVQEIIKQHSIHTEEYGDIIQVSKLEELLTQFESKPLEEQLKELDTAMQQLGSVFKNLEGKIND